MAVRTFVADKLVVWRAKDIPKVQQQIAQRGRPGPCTITYADKDEPFLVLEDAPAETIEVDDRLVTRLVAQAVQAKMREWLEARRVAQPWRVL